MESDIGVHRRKLCVLMHFQNMSILLCAKTPLWVTP